MKAWLSGTEAGRQALALQEVASPVPGAGEVLIDVHAAALNFSDLLMIDGTYQVRPPRPFVPGQEVAGIVIAAPPGGRWKAGDRVASKTDWGGFSERVAVPEAMPVALAPGLDMLRGAAIPVSYTTARVALAECVQLRPGDTVLVHAAAGALGLAAVQLAVAMGARVIATAGNAAKLRIALANGAAEGVCYAEDNWVDQIRQIAPGGVEVVFDPVGGEIGETSLRCLARDGTLLTAGFASGRIPRFAGNRLLLRRAAVRGVYWNHAEDPAMLARTTEALGQAIAAGTVAPLVDCRDGLEGLPAALADLASRRSAGKIVLRLKDGENQR